MRVLLVSSSSGSRGGGEFFLVFLGEALRGLGVEPALWLSSDPQMDGLADLFAGTGPVLRHRYTNTYLRRSRSLAHLAPGRKLGRAIRSQWRSFAPDVIHMNKQCLEDGLDLLQFAAQQEAPQGCTIHITQTAVELNAYLGRLRDWLARRALRRYPGALWAISAGRAAELGRFLGRSGPVPHVANGVRIPPLEQVARDGHAMRRQFFGETEPAGPVAVCVGRLEEQKDPFRFLEIVAAWKAAEPGLTAVWVGDGRLREAFDNRITAMGATGWIRCAGWQADPLPFLCMADVYVHPARFEGLPFALLEAMAHGKPCVLSPSLANELKEIPQEAWIIAGAQADQWLGRLADRAFLDKQGGYCRQLATDLFSVQAMARAYMGLYEGLIHRKQELRS